MYLASSNENRTSNVFGIHWDPWGPNPKKSRASPRPLPRNTVCSVSYERHILYGSNEFLK